MVSSTLALAVHCVVITLLYCCQGLATSLPGLFPVLIQAAVPGFPVGKIAFLSIWSYPFAVKFIWASLVDAFYSSTLEKRLGVNRRSQWVIPLQLCMAFGYWLLHARGEASILAESSLEWASWDIENSSWTEALLRAMAGNNLTSLFVIVLALLVLGATQDVAVDAWAVEGLPDELSGLGGTLQIVGLVLGSSLTNLFLLARSGQATDEVRTVLGLSMTLDVWFGFSAALCCMGSVLALALSVVSKAPLGERSSDGHEQHPMSRLAARKKKATRSRSRTPGRKPAIPVDQQPAECTIGLVPSSGTSLLSSYRKLGAVFRTQPVLDMVCVMLSRGWSSAASSLMLQSLLSRGIVVAADVAQLRLACTCLQVASGIFFAPSWNRQHSPGWVFRNANKLDLVLNAIALMSFSLIAYFPSLHRAYFYMAIVPTSVIASLAGTISFVAVVQQSSYAAKQFPTMTAAIITYMYSVANFGYLMPSSACLFAAEHVTKLLSGEPHVGASLLGLTCLVIAIALRFVILQPAAQRMEADWAKERSPIDHPDISDRSSSSSAATPQQQLPAVPATLPSEEARTPRSGSGDSQERRWRKSKTD